MAVYDEEKEKQDAIAPKRDGSHDDLGTHPERREAEIADLEKSYAAPTTTDTKALSPEELQTAENQPGTDVEPEASPDQVGRGYTDADTSKRRGLSKNRKLLFGAGGGAGLLAVIVVLVFLSSLKAIHFGEVLATSGYARFNGVFQERTTQDIFDASLTQGEGSVDTVGRTLVDRIKFRNLDLQLADLGRQDKLKFNLKNGQLDSVAFGDGQEVSLDGITKELGFGDNFSSISEGWTKLSPNKLRSAARVRMSLPAVWKLRLVTTLLWSHVIYVVEYLPPWQITLDLNLLLGAKRHAIT